MPYNLTIEFDFPINVSVQPGDSIYGTKTTALPGHDIGIWSEHGAMGAPLYLGTCFAIDNDNNKIIIDPVNSAILDPATSPPNIPVVPPEINYIMFSKDKTANTGNVKGYFAEVELRNNSKTKAE